MSSVRKSSVRKSTKLFLIALAIGAAVLVNSTVAHASTWQQLSPVKSPQARYFPAMAYDPVSEKVVLFGGEGNNANLNDTWVFDGTNWTQLHPTVAPPVRNGATMAYDRSLKKLVMFGGFNVNQYLQDTWEWDGAASTWTQVVMKNPPPKATGAMLFTDPRSGRAMMFGGYNAFQVIPAYNVTYRFNGVYWSRLNPSTTPFPRGWGIATLDPIRRSVVLTAGNGDTIRTDNTWTWDGYDWTLDAPTTQIPSYVGAGSTYDPAINAVVVFGVVDDTWSWNGTDWVQLSPSISPPARSGEGMAYDPIARQTLMFGGMFGDGTIAGDTWVFVGP